MSVAPGFFRIHPYAAPPLQIGEYVLEGDVDIPGTGASFERLDAAFDVVGPRYQLPPDQVLSTYPPSGSRGAYSRRLPQIVIRRRTLPWEWSSFPGGGGTPTPWLALVLIAPGEGTVKTDQPIAECVTAGTELSFPHVADTPLGTCLEVPGDVVASVFPTKEELSYLAHIREVDVSDTELAMGDDDGWLAVVLCNRLPQPGVTYTACLINVEGQEDALPTDPPVAEDFDPNIQIVDISAFAPILAGLGVSSDAAGMGAPNVPLIPAVKAAPALYASTTAGAAWAAGTARDVSGTAQVGAKGSDPIGALPLQGTIDLPYHLFFRTRRYPVLTSWSFTCEGDGDFATLANNVSSRLLGHVATGPEAPDGGPADAARQATTLTEPLANRPLPLVAESGHVVTEYRSRLGEDGQAYFRGPLTPYPTVRPTPGDGERVVVAHHSDQLRRVVPDGMQDLTYAAAFEIGRLLALSSPGVVALLSQWRRRRFAAAAKVGARAGALDRLSAELRGRIARGDPLVAGRAILPDGLPGPLPDALETPLSGRQVVRGLLSVLGDDADGIAKLLPDAPPGFARDDPETLIRERGARLATGLGVDADLSADAATIADALSSLPVAAAEPDRAADLVAARAFLEGAAGDLAAAAQRIQTNGFAFGNERRPR